MMLKTLLKSRFLLTVVFLITVISLLPAAEQSPLTIESILSCPFPSQLVSIPQKDCLAWVSYEKGRRNIWVAWGPDYAASKITNYTEDNGQVISNLTLSPDASIIVYVLGGSPNRQGEIPNPTSNLVGSEQAVWAIRSAGGKPWRLGEGNHPRISPRGDRVIFSRQGELYIVPMDGSAKPELLFKLRGASQPPCWSPDGERIVFVSSREDHSFVGLYDHVKETLSWIDPVLSQDIHPVWSPNGKQIAFLRFPCRKADESPLLIADIPFSIQVMDIETGKSHTVWRTDRGGGFAQYYNSQSLIWADDHRLIFYSEHENWMHLYSVSVDNGEVCCVTPGDYEVENMTLSVDGKTIIFNSNYGDIDRRHLWSVSVKGGALKRLTRGSGIEWRPVVAGNDERVAFFCSTAKNPASLVIIPMEGGAPKRIYPDSIPAEFPLNQLVEPQQVVFNAADGMVVHGQLFPPRTEERGKRFPAVIFMHGGPIRQMLLGWHYRGYYHNAYAFNQYLANNGYVVFSVNFRSGIGYGLRFRNAPNLGPRGASEYQDILAAAGYLQQRTDVIPTKIALWGGSYGGYLTALGLARDSDLFAAGVDLHGVHDWALRSRRWNGNDGWGLKSEEELRVAYESSPVADVASWTSPVLFVHGDDDRNVDFIQTADLVQRLVEKNKAHVETLILPDEVHGFLLHKSWLTVYQAAADFFDRFLK